MKPTAISDRNEFIVQEFVKRKITSSSALRLHSVTPNPCIPLKQRTSRSIRRSSAIHASSMTELCAAYQFLESCLLSVAIFDSLQLHFSRQLDASAFLSRASPSSLKMWRSSLFFPQVICFSFWEASSFLMKTRIGRFINILLHASDSVSVW